MKLDRVEKYTPEMLSVVRIVVALLFLEHGSAKLLGFPTSPHGEPAFMTLMWIQGLIELVGGALLALGLFTRPVAFILSGNMAVAYFMGHASKGFFPDDQRRRCGNPLLFHLPALLRRRTGAVEPRCRTDARRSPWRSGSTRPLR